MKRSCLLKFLTLCSLVCSNTVMAKRAMRAALRTPMQDAVVVPAAQEPVQEALPVIAQIQESQQSSSVIQEVADPSSCHPDSSNCHPELDSGSSPQSQKVGVAKAVSGKTEKASGAGADNINFGITAYDPSTDTFFLGADQPVTGASEQSSLVKVAVDRNAKKVTFFSLAGDTSGFKDTHVDRLALAGSKPIVVAREKKTNVFLVNPNDGTAIKNKIGLKDANAVPAKITEPPVGIAGSNDANPLILAAVRDGNAGLNFVDFNTSTPVRDISRAVARELGALGFDNPAGGGGDDSSRGLGYIATHVLSQNDNFLAITQDTIATAIGAPIPAKDKTLSNKVITAVAGDANTNPVKAAVKALSVSGKRIVDALVPDAAVAGATLSNQVDDGGGGMRDTEAKDVAAKVRKFVSNETTLSSDLTTLAQGAAAVLESGVAWTIRTADVDSGNVKNEFKDGAKALDDILALKTEKNVGAQYASSLVNTAIQANGDIVDAADTLLKFTNLTPTDPDDLAPTKGLNLRVLDGATDALKTVRVTDAKTGKFLNAGNGVIEPFIPAVIKGDLLTSSALIGTSKIDANVLAKTFTDKVTVDATLSGANAGLDVMLARGLGLFRLEGLDDKNKEIKAKTTKEKISDLVTDVLDEAINDFPASGGGAKPQARAAVEAIKADVTLKANSTLQQPLFNALQANVVPTTNDSRVHAAAAFAEAAEKKNKTIADTIHGLGMIAGDGGNEEADATAVVKLITNGNILEVAKINKVDTAAAQAAKNAANNSVNAGAANAIVGTLGWGVRNAILTDAFDDSNTDNSVSKNYIKPMLAALSAATTKAKQKAVIDEIAKDTEGKATRAAIADSIETALKENKTGGLIKGADTLVKSDLTDLVNAILALTIVDKNITTLAANDIAEKMNPDAVTGFATLDRTTDEAAAIAAVTAAKSLVKTGVDTLEAGAAATFEAGLGWGTRKATLQNSVADVQGLLTNDNNILDKLSQALLKGGSIGTAAKNTDLKIAKAAVDGIRSDIKATLDAAGDGSDTLSEQILTSVKIGTESAVAAVLGNSKDEYLGKLPIEAGKNPVVKKTEEKLVFDGTKISGAAIKETRITPIAADQAKSLTQAAQDLTGGTTPIATADGFDKGAVAAIEGAIAWGINQAIATTARLWRSAGTDDGSNRGFAVIKLEGDDLIQKDPAKTTVTGTPAAKKLDLTAKTDKIDKAAGKTENDVLVALKKDAAANEMDSAFIGFNGSDVAMHRDNNLGVFYVGLKDVRRGKTNGAGTIPAEGADAKQGGVVPLLVGRIDTTNPDNPFVLKPFVKNPTATAKNASGQDVGLKEANPTGEGTQLVGFWVDENVQDPIRASMFHVRTMRTTTDKDYLIFNGGVNIDFDSTQSLVFALPIVSSGEHVGRLAKSDADLKAPFVVLEGDADPMPTVSQNHNATFGNPLPKDAYSAAEQKIVVGADPSFIGGQSTDNPILDMQIAGDTVYVAVGDKERSGAGYANNVEAGIFASTALFDENGTIKMWTPWQRVETVKSTYGFGVNNKAAQVTFLTTANGKPASPANLTPVVQASLVGTSGSVVSTNLENRKLTDVLGDKANFPKGVTRIINFDENTPGFQPGAMSMMVALGGDRVGLIQTAKVNVSKALDQTTEFKVADGEAVVIRNDQALKDIAPLFTATLVAAPDKTANGKGYLFVGGLGGVARLEDGTGNGFKANTGLPKIDSANGEYPGEPGVNFDFKKVDQFDGKFVVGLAADQKNKTLIALDLDSISLSTDVTGAFDIESSQPSTISDMVVVYNSDAGNFGEASTIVADLDGLHILDKDLKASDPISLGKDISPRQLIYLSPTKIDGPTLTANQGKVNNGVGGNLYVLGSDAKVYRFAVDISQGDVNDQLKLVGSKPLLDLGATRDGFATNSGFFFDYQNLSLENTELLRVVTPQGNVQSLTGQLGTTLSMERISSPVFDTASGGVVIPLTEGARVIE